MSNNSPHPNSLSPHSKGPTSAFQWPIPTSPSALKSVTISNNNDITVKEILDRYNDDPELLKYILTAKSEEDKKKAARDTLKTEEARIQLRQMDLEYAREQSKRQNTSYPHPYVHPQPAPQPVTATGNHPYPYYGLAPMQQQVLARFNYPPAQQQQQQQPHQQQQPYPYQHHHHHQAPLSPSVPYPHSAHPLCPPSSSTTTNTSNNSNLHKISPTSPIKEEAAVEEEKNLKRNRSSISTEISHNKVMEALKAKIQRSNHGGPPSPSPLTPITKKRKALPKPPPPVVATNTTTSSSSPRSAKPVLPPIDTNLGRITKPTTENNIKKETTTTTTSYSPSDHILLNTRRARSLSASSPSKE